MKLFALLLVLSLSPKHIAVTPAPTAGAEFSGSAAAYLKKVIAQLPSWKTDILAPYEQREIADLENDIQAALAAPTEIDFLIDISQLHNDAAVLQALDDTLQKRMVL